MHHTLFSNSRGLRLSRQSNQPDNWWCAYTTLWKRIKWIRRATSQNNLRRMAYWRTFTTSSCQIHLTRPRNSSIWSLSRTWQWLSLNRSTALTKIIKSLSVQSRLIKSSLRRLSMILKVVFSFWSKISSRPLTTYQLLSSQCKQLTSRESLLE